MSDRLLELGVFVRSAETQSFSRAAREFGLSQPSVSRMVARVETRLGVKLLLRTTRRVTLTDAGAIYLERAREIIGAFDEAADAARGIDSLQGTLRIAASSAFGTREVIPCLSDFMAMHPELKIELLISDRLDDLILERADMALRLGRLGDSGFGARLLASAPRLAIASPHYLTTRGVPKTAADLSRHDCIVGPGASDRSGWTFSRSGVVMSVAVEGRVQVASAEGVIACVKAGLGIAIASHWMCRAELETGEVQAILEDYALQPVDVHAVYPAGPRPSPKVRAFSDYLAAALNGKTATGSTRPLQRR